ncbi:EamA family transporter RarD [Sphingomonas panacisoli]|uniref:EamA family transporter RarD n=1 Tax=Sphingomonas panacisoli TaxID=1813879 RepID=A0A5B8LJY9_9SPHN|nr:EamA family transporter RarD [Sphingomonas panacisoli]QDZ08558.1 EamA family transporter RarD [Sphingomonas panacisoli]
MLRRINPGILYGVTAYAIWGLLPAFLKLLKPMPAPDILAWRILGSLVLLIALAAALRHGATLRKIVATPRLVGALTASSILIAINWLVYIFAVNGGHVAQASLGYFINPLVNILLGTLILREKLGKVEGVAVALATSGVAFLAWHQGGVPVIPLTLAFSFGTYGLIRKVIPVEAIDGLLIETAILSPISLLWLVFAGSSLAAGPSPLLIPAAGILTAIPLILFAAAAKRVRYSDLGLIQYLAPTLQLILAVALYGEPISHGQWAAFGMIWLALAIYAAGATLTARREGVVTPE